MNLEELNNQIELEILDLNLTVDYIKELYGNIGKTEPDAFQKAAITQFVAQFYNGIENILKKVCKYRQISLPYGANSHIELFNMFVSNNNDNNPILFPDMILDDFIGIRKFRHFAIHGYAFKINWEYIKSSVSRIADIFDYFKIELYKYLAFERDMKDKSV
jgi:hypothetical protein